MGGTAAAWKTNTLGRTSPPRRCASGNADAAAGGGGKITSGCTVPTPCVVAPEPEASASDGPNVLRQHLDRRKQQLESMQQRLAKLSQECESLQDIVTSS